MPCSKPKSMLLPADMPSYALALHVKQWLHTMQIGSEIVAPPHERHASKSITMT